MLSTYHDDSMVGRSRKSKAAEGGLENILVVDEYNKFMRGADKSKFVVGKTDTYIYAYII